MKPVPALLAGLALAALSAASSAAPANQDEAHGGLVAVFK
jgi:hypothetical protein